MSILATFGLSFIVALASASAEGDNALVHDRATCARSSQLCCPRIGTKCNCVGTFKDGNCCPGCCTFNCHQGRWRCKESCGAEVDPPCTSWGWPWLGQCPADGASCRCSGYYIDQMCCSKVGFCRFRCENGKWKREERCKQCKELPGVGNGGLCPAAGSTCTCQGEFRDIKCCSKNGYCTFACVNGKWVYKEKCGLPSCSTTAKCGYSGAACRCVGSTGGSHCCLQKDIKRQLETEREDLTKFLLGGCRYATCSNGRWRCTSACQPTKLPVDGGFQKAEP